VTKGDQLVERGATRLQELADRAAARGDGIGEWLSEELRNDAAFLRKLKPSLVKARAKGDGPTNETPANPAREAPPPAPPAPDTPVAESQPTEVRAAPPPQPKPKNEPKKRRGGPPPVLIVGAALVAGIMLAKIVDWRGHAHPRD
jgi:hypothetical protein